jgi:hypothetical protein
MTCGLIRHLTGAPVGSEFQSGYYNMVCNSTTTNWTGTGGWTYITGAARAPLPGDKVLIPASKKATINNASCKAKTVVVAGELTWNVGANTRLEVETIIVVDGGKLTIGNATSVPATIIAPNKTAEISFTAPSGTSFDPEHMMRGLIADGGAIIRMNGTAKQAFLQLNGNVLSGANSIATTNSMSASIAAGGAAWAVNDLIVLPGTRFARGAALENEKIGINTITGSTATLKAATQKNHKELALAAPALRPHVANLTRNIIISSNSASPISDRGHVMLMTDDADIRGVRFVNLGRTDKSKVVTDSVDGAGNTNTRGRYAFHVHKAGLNGSTVNVQGCVVEGTVGWGFVNHGSKVIFNNNVAYNFRGAGFVAEDGDEMGSFTNNIAIGGSGNGEFPYQQSVFINKPRYSRGDTGFSGEGFWFQGPDLTVTGNVAAGCKGIGFVFWGGGRIDRAKAPANPPYGHFTSMEKSRAQLLNPDARLWDFDHNGTADGALLSDLPIRQFRYNSTYGCFMGLKLRFVNHKNIDIYDNAFSDEDVEANIYYNYLEDILGYNGTPASVTNDSFSPFTVDYCSFWNNMNGLHCSYVTNGTFDNLRIEVDASDPSGMERGFATDFHHVTSANVLKNSWLRNYRTAIWWDASPAPDGNGANHLTRTNLTYQTLPDEQGATQSTDSTGIQGVEATSPEQTPASVAPN